MHSCHLSHMSFMIRYATDVKTYTKFPKTNTTKQTLINFYSTKALHAAYKCGVAPVRFPACQLIT